jgi:adenylate cyclase
VRRLVLDEDDIELTDVRLRERYASVGEEREVAILFADIRGFTAFSESLLPYDVIFVLNRFLHDATTCVEEIHGGRISSFMGDGLMALFGLTDRTNPALAAVDTGLDLLSVVEERSGLLEALYGTGSTST